MSIYGNSNDPNQQYASSLQALQASDALMRNDISTRQQRQVAAQDLDPSTAQGPQQTTGDMEFPSAGGPTGPVTPGNTTVPTGKVATAPAPTENPGINYAYAPDSTNAELKRLANMRVQGPANVASATDMARNSPIGQAERFRQLQMVNGSDGNNFGTDIPSASVSPVATGVPKAPTTLAEYNASRPAKTPTAGQTMTGTSVGSPSTQYDNPTKYDPIIQQAATQNGVDPTILKRLLGSESSFNPIAVSPRGAQYGYGIAQIAASHGLSKQQMEDPAVAIPFAAKLLKQYADSHGGDMNAALLAYKGASSPAGIASMQPIVAKILGGGQQANAAPAQSVQAETPPAATAQGPTFVGPGGAFQLPTQYDDQTLASIKQQAMLATQQLQLAQMRYQANPQDPATGQAYMAAQQQAGQAKQGYYDSQIYQVTQAAQSGNMNAFKTLFQEYTSKTGTPIQLVPAGNGTYAMRTQGGQVIATGSPHDLAGTMGFALNRGAQQLSMQVQQEKAMAMAKQAPELAKAYYQGNVELLKQMGINSSQEFQKAIELKKIQVGTSNDGTVYVINPMSGNATKLGGPQTGKFDASGTSVAIQ